MLRVWIDGERQIRRKFEAMTRGAQRGTVRRAARAGAKPIMAEMRRLAPRSVKPRHPKGHAYKTIRYVQVDSWPDRAEYAIGPSGWGWYLALHERGTSRFGAQPFMRPALESQQRVAIQETGTVFREAILYAAQKGREKR